MGGCSPPALSPTDCVPSYHSPTQTCCLTLVMRLPTNRPQR